MEHKIIQRDIDSLIFAEYNPRQLTKDQHQHLKDSIQRFGLVDPILVNKHKDRKDIIIGGHQRVRVAKDLDIDKVPCIELSLPYEKERELNVRLNKNSGEWDYDVLANMFEMEELQDWGFADKDFWFLDQGELSNDVDYSDNTVDEKLKRFLDAKIKQITIPFPSEEFDIIVERLDRVMEKLDIEDYSQLIKYVLDSEDC